MRPRILFVDDDPDLLESVRDALRKERFQIFTVTSGADALALMADQPIDVVVSDERMPEMCGSELLAEVHRRHPHCPRILLTGQASVEAAIRAINEGAIFRFLTKPCPPATLTKAIRGALELAKQWVSDPEASDEENRRAILGDLEKDYPGITEVKRTSSGAILLDEGLLGSEFPVTFPI